MLKSYEKILKLTNKAIESNKMKKSNNYKIRSNHLA